MLRDGRSAALGDSHPRPACARAWAWPVSPDAASHSAVTARCTCGRQAAGASVMTRGRVACGSGPGGAARAVAERATSSVRELEVGAREGRPSFDVDELPAEVLVREGRECAAARASRPPWRTAAASVRKCCDLVRSATGRRSSRRAAGSRACSCFRPLPQQAAADPRPASPGIRALALLAQGLRRAGAAG